MKNKARESPTIEEVAIMLHAIIRCTSIFMPQRWLMASGSVVSQGSKFCRSGFKDCFESVSSHRDKTGL